MAIDLVCHLRCVKTLGLVAEYYDETTKCTVGESNPDLILGRDES